MKIKHYLYNTFLIEEGNTKIAIDPGQNLWMFKLQSLIPKSEWNDITHILHMETPIITGSPTE